MAGSVTRGGQQIPVPSATQGVGSVSSSGTGLDGKEHPFVVLIDENNPDRKVSPAGYDLTGTAALSSVAASASSVSLLAANTARKGVTIVNDSTATLYLAYAATASTTSYTYKLQAGETFEMPGLPYYGGAISGIWSAANGNARITELS